MARTPTSGGDFSPRLRHYLIGPFAINEKEEVLDRQGILRARVQPHHADRLAELCIATGLNASQVIRLLIEKSELRPQLMPSATVVVGKNDTDVAQVLLARDVRVS